MTQLSPHFWTEEFECKCGCGFGSHAYDISVRLLARLEELRERRRRPVIISSGCRCAAHNAAIGGSPTSEHMHGEAVDIVCSNSMERWELLSAAFHVGFRRIGIERGCIHVGVSMSLPQPVAFFYQTDPDKH